MLAPCTMEGTVKKVQNQLRARKVGAEGEGLTLSLLGVTLGGSEADVVAVLHDVLELVIDLSLGPLDALRVL